MRHLAGAIARTFAAGRASMGRQTRPRRAAALAAAFAASLLAAPAPATAQNFTPAARVDGAVISLYELNQRTRFLSLLRAPGDVRALAMDQLINERLQLREAQKAGITVSDEQIQTGIDEFAARGNLDGEQLLQLLAQGGIAAQSFRDFVTAGLTWREFVKANVAPQVALSQADIELAMGEIVPEAGLRVLLSEIALPAGDPATRRASEKRAERLVGLDEAAFADAATRFSVARSRNSQGELSWVDIASLPPAVGAAVRGLTPGQTTRALPVGDQIRVYLLRERDQVKGGQPATAVEYAALLLPGGATEANLSAAADIRARVTGCDDLYPYGRGLPPEMLIREEIREAAVPQPYRGELALLDPGEISTRVTGPGGALAVVMLCSRGNELPPSITAEQVAAQLRSSRTGTMAQMLLDEWKANAFIEILR